MLVFPNIINTMTKFRYSTIFVDFKSTGIPNSSCSRTIDVTEFNNARVETVCF